MLALLRRLFHKEEAPEPGSLVEELWVADLAATREDGGEGRFLEVEEDSHRASYEEGGLLLELKRPDLFAWTEAPRYRQADFVLHGDFQFGGDRPYAACGFLFRYQDERNFYSALVSNRGYIRLDVVFNGSPRSLVAWTELDWSPAAAPAGSVPEPGSAPEAGPRDFGLTVIARGSSLSLLVDDQWVAEAVDETFRQGHIAFAAQRFGEAGEARFLARSCMIDSRPVQVETWYYRWNFYIEPAAAARYRLAQTYHAMGEFLSAAVQLRKLERRRALLPDELFLKAEVALRLELYDEADAALDACLAAGPDRADALGEKANLLYLRSRYPELRSLLESVLPANPDNARLAVLSGHARFALGDFVGAAEEYRRAASLDPEQALFRMNEARSWDQAKRRQEAAEAYLAAARLFFRQEADDDLALALQRLSALRPRSPEVKELRAKTFFRQGKTAKARALLEELVAAGSEDSAVHYLLGLLRSEGGRREEALTHFERAGELEPGYPLYAFRIAEARFSLGLDCREAVERALSLAPEDGWTCNLAGQEAMARGELVAARALLEAARAALPAAPEPAINLAELESREGRLEAALAALAPFPTEAACRNQAGNAYAAAALAASSSAADGAADGEGSAALLERAAAEYEAACRLEPGSCAYETNLAAAYMRLERYSEAETRIRAALDAGGEPRTYLLAGDLGAVLGDRVRAETSYRLGLELAPGDPGLLLALGRHYLLGREASKARELQVRLAAADGAAGARLAEEIEEATTDLLSCASCGRAWRVPKDLPAQSGTSIRAMPPDESPAGACPRCGKIYCIACRKGELVDSRFTCPDCGESLKLSDNRLRWLVHEHLKRLEDGRPDPLQGS